jgi:hypothetical protein
VTINVDATIREVTGGIGAIGTAEHITIQSGGRQRPHTANLKYRADRIQQEVQIREALETHLRLSARRPIVFIAHGARSQCLDSFAERIKEHTIPHHLKSLLGSDVRQPFENVRWPTSGRRLVAAREREYRQMVALKLEISQDFDHAAIVDKIANHRSPVILSSLHTEVAGEDDEATLQIVLDFWGQMVDLRADLTLIIILAFTYAERRSSFFDRFRSKPATSVFAEKLWNFEGYRPDRLRVVVLPELDNVTLEDAEDWVREFLKPLDVDLEETLARARRFFNPPDVKIPMQLLATQLGTLVPKDREFFRQL